MRLSTVLNSLLQLFILVCFICINRGQECSSDKSICEFWLTVERRLTMVWKSTRVIAKNGTLFTYDKMEEVPMEEVITMDGIARSVIAVNNTVPGPPLIVYEGQELVIHVKNHLLSESITVHWHGLHQRETPFMDGVAFISQCPITTGQKFTYRFKAYPRGTFWYHSHIGGQRVDGLYGALIIKPKPSPIQKESIDEHIMHIGDWFHQDSSTLHARMIYGNFKSKLNYQQPKTLDGVYFAPVVFKSAIIEGRGQHKDPNTGISMQTPLKSYNVESGKKYRFRVIGSSMIYPFRVSVDNHMLTIISSDGYDIVPRIFESFVINPGERYDFMITADQPVGNYWIRSEGMEVGFNDHNGQAILRYDSTSRTEPSTTRMNCTKDKPCEVLNCQFSYYPKNKHTTCVRIDELDALNGETTPVYDNEAEEHFQNWVQGQGRMVINGKVFEHPDVSSLTQHDDIENNLHCDKVKCGIDKYCYCQHELSIPFNKTIQMIWTNHGKGATRHHPIHLHGHSFHVLKMGYANYNETTGELISLNHAIDCGNTPKNFCNKPGWSNPNWKNGNIPDLKIKNTPQKDSLMVPVGGYAVIRFRSDNPGKWFLHCHLEFHSMQGMAMILNEAYDKQKSPPKGFPVCHSFDPERDLEYVKGPVEHNGSKDDNWTLLLVIVVTLSVILVLENVIVIIKCYTCRTKTKSGNMESSNTQL